MAEVRRDGEVIDAVNASHGFRELIFSGADNEPSCRLNRKPFKWRGFCDHANFAVCLSTPVPVADHTPKRSEIGALGAGGRWRGAGSDQAVQGADEPCDWWKR
jgi:hypothetical protein